MKKAITALLVVFTLSILCVNIATAIPRQHPKKMDTVENPTDKSIKKNKTVPNTNTKSAGNEEETEAENKELHKELKKH